MISLSRLTLKTKFYIIVGAAAAGFVTIGITTQSAVRNARVDAPGMVALLDSKDLLTDVLPPSAHLLEAYTVTLEMLEPTGREELSAFIERGERLSEVYRERSLHWAGSATDQDLRRSLLAADAAGQRFLMARDQQFIPALQAGDRGRAQQVFRDELQPAYREHRARIDEVVTGAHRLYERSAAAVAHDGRVRVLEVAGITAVLTALLLLLGLTLRRSVTEPLQRVGEFADAMAAGDTSGKLYLDSKDELGWVAFSFTRLCKAQREFARTAQAIAEGDLSVEVTPRGDADVLAHALLRLRENLTGVTAEAQSI
ncbi:MAG: HAMP domain-containing protein, partial [Gemmatimonadales bacterium]